ncbi:MAG: dTDP-4-dehydrorhamnose 3,5-epimerase [Muribaculaceae bacterium]|nr:dTDP-4-dehydrorhamnose 3,5-epimerase [Muribaculaceae bacterium]
MRYIETEIPGVWIIEPKRFGDERGWFMETFRLNDFRQATGLTGLEFVQDNESMSRRGVLRGLHFQRGAHAQAKLVRVSLGRVLDVAVDLREGSPTYGRHVAVELSDETGRQVFIPRGFAHGFLVLSDEARFEYKVDNYYSPGEEVSVRYDDPDLAIAWPLDGITPQLSEKDIKALYLKEI